MFTTSQSVLWPVHDTKAMIDRLEVAEAARAAAVKDLPASDATEPDLTEQTIRAQFEAVRRDLNEEAQAVHDEVMTVQQDLLAQTEGVEIEACPRRVAANVRAFTTAWLGDLTEANDREKQCRLAKQSLEHAVGGSIDPNDSGGQFLVIASLLVLVLVESISNGLVLGIYAEGGIVGGIIQAFAISILSVGLSWTFGDALRHLFDASRIGRVLAVLGIAVYGGVLVAYHTVVAWLRMVLQHADRLSIENGDQVYVLSSKPHEAFEWAIPFALRYGIDPGHLDDVNAWFLLIVGCFFGLGAFVAGWRQKTVRGRSARARVVEAHKAAQNAVRAINASYLEEYTQLHQDGLVEVQDCVAEANKAMTALRGNTIRARRNEAEHKTRITALGNAFVVAIEYFRTTNAGIRATPVPQYFYEAPEPLADDGFRLDMTEIAIAENRLGKTLDAVRLINEKAGTAKNAIHRHLEAGLAMAPTYLAGFCSTSNVSRYDPYRPRAANNDGNVVAAPQLLPLH